MKPVKIAVLIFTFLFVYQNIYASEISVYKEFSTANFKISLPEDTRLDFSMSPIFVKANNKDFDLTISYDSVHGKDMAQYIDYYYNRFILDDGYRRANGIQLIKNEDNGNIKLTSISIDGLKEGRHNIYTYAFIKTDSRENKFYRLMFKHSGKADKIIEQAIASFKQTGNLTEKEYNLDFYPITPENWNDETKKYYNEILSKDKPDWGIFTYKIETEGIDEDIPAMEKALDYKFDIILYYRHVNMDFPLEFMNKCYEQGRIVELTYQLTESNNESLFIKSPTLEIYKGSTEYENRIREFAKAAKKFEHPFLFRLNNEMNSDWTSYGGVVNLCDPDIYIAVWQRIYEIFEEEGVDNAIWIFNPNDESYPPAPWNNGIAYYPGNKYVHMYGVTGYNTGKYLNWQRWREFNEIYGNIAAENYKLFSRFPWIITEFASSSIGGDKAKWIKNMFSSLHMYPQIKIAVWFNVYNPAKNLDKSKPVYSLLIDETAESLEAFKRGLNN